MFGTRLTIGLLCMCVLGFAAIGCSDRGPVDSTEGSVQETPDFIKLPKRMEQSLNRVVSTSKFITAATGGTITLTDTYRAAPDSKLVSIFIKLKLKPNALPYDASLTLSIDRELFVSTVAMTFGPHGIVFNKAAELDVEATGIDLGPGEFRLKMYYINSVTGLWERMPGSKAEYEDNEIEGEGKLPHFSQYAFGR